MSLNVLTAGQGRPLLLLHGFTGSAGSWLHQTPVWAEHHRVIAPDLLGHGGSDVPTDPRAYSLDSQADVLSDLLDLLDASPADVVGYSMGARLGLALVLAHPQAVGRLVLESPSAGMADADERQARRAADDDLAERIERDGLEAFVDRWEASPLFASANALPRAQRQRLRAERLSHDPRGLAASLRGAGQGVMEPLHDRLAAIAAPTLVIAGALDPVGGARARGVAGGIPGARLEIIADAGHTPHLERPDDFTRIVAGYLAPTPTIH